MLEEEKQEISVRAQASFYPSIENAGANSIQMNGELQKKQEAQYQKENKSMIISNSQLEEIEEQSSICDSYEQSNISDSKSIKHSEVSYSP